MFILFFLQVISFDVITGHLHLSKCELLYPLLSLATID